MEEIIVSRKKINVISDVGREVRVSVGGRVLYMPKHLFKKLESFSSDFVKLIVLEGGRVISVNSRRYRLIDNELLFEVIEKAVPVQWLRVYSKVDDLILHVRYELPIKVSADSRALFVVFNINDGKTAVKAFYGFNFQDGGSCLPLEIQLMSRHVSRTSSAIYETLKVIRGWKKWVDRLSKLRIEAGKTLDRDTVVSLLKKLHERGYILKRHLDKAFSILASQTAITLWDLVTVAARVIGSDKEFKKNDARWVRAERAIGKLLMNEANPSYLESR